MATAGFTGTEADEVRRAFGFKRSEARMKEVEGKGIANVIVTSQLFQRHRLALVTEPILLVEGLLGDRADAPHGCAVRCPARCTNRFIQSSSRASGA